MLTLLTKDGTKTGNAILYGGTTPEESGMDTPRGEPVYFVETDFGNHMTMTWREITEMFTVGRVCDYGIWRADRENLHRREPLSIDNHPHRRNTKLDFDPADFIAKAMP